MKKILQAALMTSVLAVLMCTTALAADTVTQGIYDAEPVGQNVSIALDGDTSEAEIGGETKTVTETEQLQLTYSSAENGSYYLVLVLDDDTGIPTADNIVYIDQLTASGDSVTFNIYPSRLEPGKAYTIGLSGSDANLTGLTQVASYRYYVAYTLGDVNNDGTIDVSDVMAVINHIVEITSLSGNQLLAADTTGNQVVDVSDAMKIVNYIVGVVSNFD
jgi:hypothetical protein